MLSLKGAQIYNNKVVSQCLQGHFSKHRCTPMTMLVLVRTKKCQVIVPIDDKTTSIKGVFETSKSSK